MSYFEHAIDGVSLDLAHLEPRIYFHLRRAQAGRRHQLLLVVESAYPRPDRQAILAGTTKISFPVLCTKIYRGEQVRPQARR